MTIKVEKWDTAKYLRTEEDIQAYLKACIEEAPNDEAFIAKALGTIARARKLNQTKRNQSLPSATA